MIPHLRGIPFPKHGLLIIDMDSVNQAIPTYKTINYAIPDILLGFGIR